MGTQRLPVDYTVERTRDGRSYSNRRVVAAQEGSVIFVMGASFHADEPGLEHQLPMPVVGERPDELPSIHDAVRFPGGMRSTLGVIDVRVPAGYTVRHTRAEPAEHRHMWFRSSTALGDSPAEHVCLLAFASDLMPSLIVLSRHAVSHREGFETASLDHAIWFHRSFRADRWLCYDQLSPVAFGGRGLFTGSVFTEEGLLVATVIQEVMLRVRP